MTTTPVLQPEILVIGAGPSGLRAAKELAPKVNGQVLVLEREGQTGGIPRHSDHLGYGIRDMKRFISGPDYVRRLTHEALDAGATLQTHAMVTGWAGDSRLEVTTPKGRLQVEPKAIILATGARERARPARRIPGDRPAGVYTTGQLQNMVHLHQQAIGSRAVIVGAELVSWSAGLTLRNAGCTTVAMVTEHPRPDAYRLFSGPGSVLLRTRVRTRTRVTQVTGRKRVEAVEVENLDTGQRSRIACDTVVFTGDWIPDHELARLGGLDLDTGTLGPRVDQALRTSRAGIFAVGNLIHPVDTADVAALDGAHVVPAVLDHLNCDTHHRNGVALLTDRPFTWISPNLWVPGAGPAARQRLLFWTEELVRFPHIEARQGGRRIGSMRVPWPAAPGRVFRVPASILKNADAASGDVTLTLSLRNR
jgi:thioredoxin reductase